MTAPARIIVCDDELPMLEFLDELLTGDGYAVTTARGGAELRALVPQVRPDLVICDLNMPGEDGLSLSRWLHAEGHCAVLMLTGMASDNDRTAGLETGADDYLAKPFEPPELRSRIKAILQRTIMCARAKEGTPTTRLKVGRCVVDTERKAMFDEHGVETPMTGMEFDLLEVLISNAHRPLTRDQLLQMAHHQRWDPYDRSIDIRIMHLRKKVEWDATKPRVLRTVRGSGYMLVPDGE